MTEYLISAILLGNAIWFAMGFLTFYLRREVFAKVMVPTRDDRNNTAYAALVESGRFMGGFNFSLSVLNIGLLFGIPGFDTNAQMAFMLMFNAIAHGSQFFGNVPMALENRKGEGLWIVFKGVMLKIFVIDFVLMGANGIWAIAMMFWI